MTPEEAKAVHYSGTPHEFAIPEGVEGPVYCVGDSHVGVLPNVFPSFFWPCHWTFDDSETVFESKTAYAAGSDKHGAYVEKAYRSIPAGSQVLMSFGEIDCRHYLPRLAKEQCAELEPFVDEVIERYKRQCLNAFQQKYRLMVLGVYVTPADHHHENGYEDIFSAKRLLNEKLEAYCAETGALMVPIWTVSQDEAWDSHPVGTYFGDDSHASGCLVPVILDAMSGYKWTEK